MASFVNLLFAKNFLCTFKVQTTKVQTNRARIQQSIARLLQHLIETLSVLIEGFGNLCRVGSKR
jgi:hypothetical protein